MSAPILFAPFMASSLVLMGGGAAKLVHPADTANAIARLGVPRAGVFVRLLAAVEVAVGIWALLDPSPLSATLVGASYAGFAVVVGLALRRHLPLSTCGCFGEPDTPPTLAHLGITVVAAVIAALEALVGALRMPSWAALTRGVGGAGVLLATLLLAWAVLLVLSGVARLRALGFENGARPTGVAPPVGLPRHEGSRRR